MQTSKFEVALAMALELSDEDRRKLVELIDESLPQVSGENGYDPTDVADWNRRLAEYRTGRSIATPVDEVMAKLRRKYG